jgi:hypothetical protein
MFDNPSMDMYKMFWNIHKELENEDRTKDNIK